MSVTDKKDNTVWNLDKIDKDEEIKNGSILISDDGTFKMIEVLGNPKPVKVWLRMLPKGINV